MFVINELHCYNILGWSVCLCGVYFAYADAHISIQHSTDAESEYKGVFMETMFICKPGGKPPAFSASSISHM
ncbi:hypothetical protein HHUSO_G11678 [Huso huso]|uniref:Secreted protein n=1 Tax=Huso huso TaxID=61971 RepID=A0ABR0ZLV7_HUSHU